MTNEDPGIDVLTANNLRAIAIQMMRQRHGPDIRTWPVAVQEQYGLLSLHQAEHDAIYLQPGHSANDCHGKNQEEL
jgi:hypothetical protein